MINASLGERVQKTLFYCGAGKTDLPKVEQPKFSAPMLLSILTFGSKERIEHLKLIWAGGFAGYVVTVEAIDPSAKPRENQVEFT